MCFSGAFKPSKYKHMKNIELKIKELQNIISKSAARAVLALANRKQGQSYTFESLTTQFVPWVCFTFVFKLSKQASSYLKDNRSISLNLHEVFKRKHWKFHFAIKGIYFFFCIYGNRPWHYFRCRFFVLFGWTFACHFLASSLSQVKEVFYASQRIFSSFQNREEPLAHFEKRFCSFLALQKVTLVFKNTSKWHCRKICYNLTIVVLFT